MHLGLAFVLLGLIAWYVLRLSRREAELLQARRQRNEGLIAWGSVLVAVAFVQILLGALVAGIDAGRNYTDWPLMGGELFPSTAFNLEPVWSNFLANPGLVQFNHRLVGYALFVLGAIAWRRSRSSALDSIRGAFAAMMAMLAVQVGLGIVTVLHGAPLPLAIVHQLGAIALFTLIVRARFAALYPRPSASRAADAAPLQHRRDARLHGGGLSRARHPLRGAGARPVLPQGPHGGDRRRSAARRHRLRPGDLRARRLRLLHGDAGDDRPPGAGGHHQRVDRLHAQAARSRR